MHRTKVSSEWGPEVDARIDVSIGGDPSSRQVVMGHPVDDCAGFTTYLAGGVDVLAAVRGKGRRAADEISASTTNDRRMARGGGKQGLQFVTVSSLIYDRPHEGSDTLVPSDLFLQNIRD